MLMTFLWYINLFFFSLEATNTTLILIQIEENWLFEFKKEFKPVHEISSNGGLCDQQSLRSACAYAQSDQSLCQSIEFSMIVKLLTEHNLAFLSFKGGCRDSSESTHVKMPHCWKSHAVAHLS